jgi:hypothetical protein
VFVLGKPFQLSLMFVGKPGAFLLKNLLDAPIFGRLLGLPTNNRLDWNGLLGTNTQAYCENSQITDKKVSKHWSLYPIL